MFRITDAEVGGAESQNTGHISCTLLFLSFTSLWTDQPAGQSSIVSHFIIHAIHVILLNWYQIGFNLKKFKLTYMWNCFYPKIVFYFLFICTLLCTLDGGLGSLLNLMTSHRASHCLGLSLPVTWGFSCFVSSNSIGCLVPCQWLVLLTGLSFMCFRPESYPTFAHRHQLDRHSCASNASGTNQLIIRSCTPDITYTWVPSLI